MGMSSGFVRPKRKPMRLWPARLAMARLAMAGLAALVVAGSPADATDRRRERAVESIETRPAGEPIMAIVSLQSQRITIYDTHGWILRAPVSSGQSGRETPAGIFSVIQKDADHHSNLYDDAFMPHMQRLTWSGIALHGGPLPGYPASHGCVRMPFDFAERLFDLTQMGMRVIVAPTDVAPVGIGHPLLASFRPGAVDVANARLAEADEAAKKVDQARIASVKAFREAALARVPERVAENLKLRADAQLAVAETALASATSDEAKEQAEHDKADAVTRRDALQLQLDAAKAALQPKLDAIMLAREAVLAAENTRIAAAEAAHEASRALEPVSVLISRKTQRLYVRQALEPVLDVPVTIQDADRPIGTHIFTALERTGADSNMQWSVVSLEAGHSHGGVVEQGRARGAHGRNAEPAQTTDPGAASESAKSALDRIVIPQDVLDRIAAAPRSSLIITDEELSSETGKDTDFVVIMSGEPQGGIKIRHQDPAPWSGDRTPDLSACSFESVF
jgi:hypothetical protein